MPKQNKKSHQKKEPLVSIVIVNYNGERFLKRFLDTIKAQTYKKHEVIFVDNGSKDNSVKYVEKNYPHVKVIEAGNNGYGPGCNSGAVHATGKYICFLNEDMYLPKDYIEQMVKYRKKLDKKFKNRVGGIGCKMVDFDSDPNEVPKKYGGNIDLFGYPIDNHDPDDILVISGCPFFMERELYMKIKGFNDNIFIYNEDVDLSLRLKMFGYKNFMNHDTYIFHFGGAATGGFSPVKISRVITTTFIVMVTNYSIPLLFLVMPFYWLYILGVMLGVFVFKKLDIDYPIRMMKEYVKYLRNLGRILEFRNFVQRNRKHNDLSIIRYMSIIPGVLHNLPFFKLSEKYVIKN